MKKYTSLISELDNPAPLKADIERHPWLVGQGDFSSLKCSPIALNDNCCYNSL